MPRNDAWTLLGPGAGGAQYIPTISPHDDQVVLEACDMTGAYITKDGGKSWREFHLKGRTTYYAFDPVTPGVIYACANGLYKSTDNGEMWQLIYPAMDTIVDELKLGDHSGSTLVSTDAEAPHHVNGVCVDPGNTDRLFVSGMGRNGFTLYASFDGGASFAPLCQLPGKTTYKLMAVEGGCLHIGDSGVNFICDDGCIHPIEAPEGVTEYIQADGGVDPDSGEAVLYVLTNGYFVGEDYVSGLWRVADGEWISLLPNEGEALDFAPDRLPRYVEVSTSPIDANVLYVGTMDYPIVPADCADGSYVSHYGIFKSLDGGRSFRWVLKATLDHDADNRTLGWCEANYTGVWNWVGPKGSNAMGLCVAPTNPDICFMTDLSSTTATFDGGKTWQQMYCDYHPDGSVSTRGLDVTTCYGVHFDPHDANHITATYTDIGFWHSYDFGKSWIHQMHNIPVCYGNTCYWMVFDPEVPGRAWSAWGGAHDLPRPKMYALHRHYKAQGAIHRTDDGFKTWEYSSHGAAPNSVFTHIVLDPTSPAGNRTLYATAYGNGVYKSTDDGYTWQLKNNGLAGQGNLNAWKLCLTPDGKLYLVVARGKRRGQPVDGFIMVSEDGAESWQRVPLPDGINFPNDIVCDPKDPKRLYVSCWPHTMDTAGTQKEYFGGIYATDDGKNWRQIFDPKMHVFATAVDPRDSNILFATGFDHGVYRSGDRGETWKRLKGYNFHWGHRPFPDPHHPDKLFVATFGSSIWYGPAMGDDNAPEDIVRIPNTWE
nr:hypothetical protein [bacterium]